MRDILLEAVPRTAYRDKIETHIRSPGSKSGLSRQSRRSDGADASNCGLEKPVRPDGFTAPIASLTAEPVLTWGRFNTGSWLAATGCTGIVVLCPILVILLYIALQRYDGSLLACLTDLVFLGPSDFIIAHALRPTFKVFVGYSAWLIFQALLYIYLPGSASSGQLTPAGYLLKYKTNGLNAWIFTHVAAVVLAYVGILDPAVLAKNWEGLLVVANLYGFLLPTFSYLKAHILPSHAEDRKFSGKSRYPDIKLC
jgi:hypothetical protein